MKTTGSGGDGEGVLDMVNNPGINVRCIPLRTISNINGLLQLVLFVQESKTFGIAVLLCLLDLPGDIFSVHKNDQLMVLF